MRKRILIVEDEQPIREMINFALTRAGMTCVEAGDVKEAQVEIARKLPDLILLDWMLPGMSGIDFARRLRGEELSKDLPIIMLTARGHEDERILGLETGCDDYLVKPFSTRELVARINAVIRRVSPVGADSVIERDALRVDLSAHRVFAGDQPVNLGPREFQLLSFLMTHPERVYSRSLLLDHVWGGDVYVDERTVDVHVRRVRMALEPHGCDRFIQTVRGAGYRFSTTV